MNEPDSNSETWVDLPPHLDEPFDVYVNGVHQQRGDDYEVIDRALLFSRPLTQEGSLGRLRWLSIMFGIAGTYRKHEAIDIIYERNGRRHVETRLKPRE